MSDKKNIDRLFQEKFKDFEMTPNDAVWGKIEERLDRKKKKRRVIPIWWQLGGVAAALLLLVTIGNGLFNEDKIIPEVVDTETPTTISPENNDRKSNAARDLNNLNDAIVNTTQNTSDAVNTSTSEKKSEKNTAISSNNESESKKLQKNAQQNTITTTRVAMNESSEKKSSTNAVRSNNTTNVSNTSVASNSENKEKTIGNSNELLPKSDMNTLIKESSKTNAVANNTSSKEENLTEAQTSDSTIEELTESKDPTKTEQTIEEAIAETKTLNEKEEEKLRRWSIEPNAAPVYFSSLNGGSSIDDQFTNNNTNSTVSMSYGVNGSYAINKRLRLKTGVHRVSLNNVTNDIIAQSNTTLASRNAAPTRMENVTLKNTGGNNSLTILSRTNLNASTVSEAINTLPSGNLEQRFGFIEVPLELEYRVVDKKIGVNVVGGFSTLFLNENEIFADVNGASTLIGEANNLNDTSFSANFGIGIDYSLTDKLNINLEPKFKYQLNTFNNTSGDFQPFFIGVYTGLSFKF